VHTHSSKHSSLCYVSKGKTTFLFPCNFTFPLLPFCCLASFDRTVLLGFNKKSFFYTLHQYVSCFICDSTVCPILSASIVIPLVRTRRHVACIAVVTMTKRVTWSRIGFNFVVFSYTFIFRLSFRLLQPASHLTLTDLHIEYSLFVRRLFFFA
jgi:hypothetical protein